MPNLYEILMLCESVYKNKLLIANWQSIDKQVGQKDISTGEAGYFGEAFLQPQRQLIVVVHRGTKLYNVSEKYRLNAHQEKLNGLISLGNLVNDALLAFQYVPPETQPALDFALRILEHYPQHTIIQTGHSLGGFHANLVGYFCKQKVVAFDPPGCLEVLTKLLQEMRLPLDAPQLQQHYNLLAESNLINQINTQVGQVYYRKPANNDWRPIHEQSVTSRIQVTLTSHKLISFLSVITEDRIHLGLQIPDAFVSAERVTASQETSRQTELASVHRLNNKSVTPYRTHLGEKAMKNSINGTHDLTQDNWVVSIVRRKEGDHCFLILEGLGDQHERITLRAELGYKVINQNSDPIEYDKTKAQIYLNATPYDWLQRKASAKEFYYRTFEITREQKERLRVKIQADQAKELTYVEFGNQNSLAGGFVGNSLESVGSNEAKNASVASNHAFFKPTNVSSASAHSSIDASLQRGYSCVSWAIETIHSIRHDYDSTALGLLFVNIPQWEVASEGHEPSTEGCRIS